MAVLDDYQDAAAKAADWAPIMDRDIEIEFFPHHFKHSAELIRALSSYDCVVAMRERTGFGRAVLESLPRLELLVCTGHTNNLAVDFAAAAELAVTVCGTANGRDSTAALTWSLILELLRHTSIEAASLRAGGWQTTVGGDLSGRRLGILGLGRIGTAVGRVGFAFGMDVVAWSPHLSSQRVRELQFATRVSKEELFSSSDVVSLHLVLSGTTHHIVGAKELSLMKPSALLVNTARSGLVDERSLMAALEEERVAGAALDVFDSEPLPVDHPFRTMRNVLATPHIGYVTQDTYRVFYGGAVEDILAYVDGFPIHRYDRAGHCSGLDDPVGSTN